MRFFDFLKRKSRAKAPEIYVNPALEQSSPPSPPAFPIGIPANASAEEYKALAATSLAALRKAQGPNSQLTPALDHFEKVLAKINKTESSPASDNELPLIPESLTQFTPWLENVLSECDKLIQPQINKGNGESGNAERFANGVGVMMVLGENCPGDEAAAIKFYGRAVLAWKTSIASGQSWAVIHCEKCNKLFVADQMGHARACQKCGSPNVKRLAYTKLIGSGLRMLFSDLPKWTALGLLRELMEKVK